MLGELYAAHVEAVPLNAAVIGMFVAQAPPAPAAASEEAPSSVPSAPEMPASASVDASKDEAGTSAAAGEEDEEAGEVKDDEPKGLSEKSIPPRSNPSSSCDQLAHH